MEQLYGMFKGPESDGIPGVLTLSGTDTRLTIWRQDEPVEFQHLPPAWIFGRLHDSRKMTLWGIHGWSPVQDVLHPWFGNGVEAVVASPMYAVEGPCVFDHTCKHVSAITFRSPHLEIDNDREVLPQTKETDYGTLTVSADCWPNSDTPQTVIKLTCKNPVEFADAWKLMGTLQFLCEALTGRSHNGNGGEFEVPLEEHSYCLHDFHTAGASVYKRRVAEDESFPHVAPGEFLDITDRWLCLFHQGDAAYREAFSFFASCLDVHPTYDRLRVFQSANVFDLLPGKHKTVAKAILSRIKVVGAEIDRLPIPSTAPFTSENLEKFAEWGSEMRNRVVHGPLYKGAPRPAYCDDPRSWGYVCNTLEFVLALSTLIECGLEFHQWLARSQPWGRNKLRDVAFQFEEMISHLGTLASPAGTSSADKAGS